MTPATTRLMLGDCLDRMGEIADGSVDLILADLPYGTTACKWDVVIPFEPLWMHYRRLLKPRGAVVLTASQPFTSILVMSNPKWFRYEVIWEKSVSADFVNARHRPLKKHESVMVFSCGASTYNPQMERGTPYVDRSRKSGGKILRTGDGTKKAISNDGHRYPSSVIRVANPNNGSLHPTQKPVALMEYLIRTYSNEGEIVLDNTMGSGTTGVACIKLGRDFIGIEKEPDIFAIAEKCIRRAEADAASRLPFMTTEAV